MLSTTHKLSVAGGATLMATRQPTRTTDYFATSTTTTYGSKLHQQQAVQLAELRQLDEQGWSPLHHAAFRGYVKSIDRFLRLAEQQEAEVDARKQKRQQQLAASNRRTGTNLQFNDVDDRNEPTERLVELETSDRMCFRPLHLAVAGGHIDVVRCLIELHGAQVDALNSRGHTVVELAAYGRHVHILEYLLTLNKPFEVSAQPETARSVASDEPTDQQPNNGNAVDERTSMAASIWNRLSEFMKSDVGDEAVAASESIRDLLLRQRSSSTSNVDLSTDRSSALDSPGGTLLVEPINNTNVIDSFLHRKLAYDAGIVSAAVQHVNAATTMEKEKSEMETERVTKVARDKKTVAAALSILVSLSSNQDGDSKFSELMMLTDRQRNSRLKPSDTSTPTYDVPELVVDQAVSHGVVPGVIRLITTTAFQSVEIIRLAAQLLTAITTVPTPRTKALKYARLAIERGGVPALMKVISDLDSLQPNTIPTDRTEAQDGSSDAETDRSGVTTITASTTTSTEDVTTSSVYPVYIDLVDALGCVVDGNTKAQDAVFSFRGAAETICRLYERSAPSVETFTGNDVDDRVDGGRDELQLNLRPQQRKRQASTPGELAVTRAIAKLVAGHHQLQSSFLGTTVTSYLVAILRRQSSDVVALSAAVNAMLSLAERNTEVQRLLVGGKDGEEQADDVIAALLDVATRPPAQIHQLRSQARENHAFIQRLITDLQRQAVRAAWHVTGNDVARQRCVAERIGVKRLLEFVDLLQSFASGTTKSAVCIDLMFVGSEAIRAICRSADAGRYLVEASECGAVHSVARLLRSEAENVVLSATRTLRQLAVSVGYRNNRAHQAALLESRGIKLLAALSARAESQLIRAEAFYALACSALGCPENMTEIRQNVNFSYSRLVSLLRDADQPHVRSLAGDALAAFAYNSVANQTDIAAIASGKDGTQPLDFNDFLPLLQSDSALIRCYTAFQVVILAKILANVEPAVASAAGIKLLADLLLPISNSSSPVVKTDDSTREAIEAAAADCVARLSHTRHGICEAFVSVGVIDSLAELLLSKCHLVKGNASIALAYLSHNHEARRILLTRCRKCPQLMQVLEKCSDVVQLCNEKLFSDWQHFRQLTKLPPFNRLQTADLREKHRRQSTIARDLSFYLATRNNVQDSLAALLPQEGD